MNARYLMLVSLSLMGCQNNPPATDATRPLHDGHYYHQAVPESLNEPSQLKAGEVNRFAFADWRGPAIPVWLYLPSRVDVATAPILIMMHGQRRGAHRYLREWAPFAEERGVVVVAPEFNAEDFKRSRRYNSGHVFDSDGMPREEPLWTFSAIEPLFDNVRRALHSQRTHYTLYGHSAGSQFVHRFLFYKPKARVARYLAANAGWYTFPAADVTYPYGLKDSKVQADAATAALSKDVVVLLGDQDTDANHDSLRRTPEAMRQGPHRFARGLNFHAAGKAQARAAGVPFGWQVKVVPGVAHSNSGIARVAIDFVE